MGTVAKQSFLSSIHSYIGVILGAINTMVLFPRIFAPEVYGEFNTLYAVIMIASTFAHLGFPISLVVFFPKLNEEQRSSFWSFSLILLCMVSLGVGLCFGILQYLEITNLSYGITGFLVYFSIVLFELFSAISQHHSKVVAPQFIRNVFRRIIISVGLLISLAFDSKEEVFYLVFGVGYLIHLILMIIYAKPDLPRFKWQFKDINRKELLGYGLLITLASGALIVVIRIDVLMIKSMLGASAVAFYWVAYFIGNVISVPVKSVIASIRPFVAKAWAREDLDEVDKLYKKSAITQLAITGFTFMLIIGNLDLAMMILPKEYHIEAFPWIVFFIGLSEVVKGASGINGLILVVSNKQRYNFYIGIILILLTIIGNWLLIPIYGLSGAAIASLAAIFLYNLVKLLVVHRFYKLLPVTKQFFSLSLAIGLSIALILIIKGQAWNIWLSLAAVNLVAIVMLSYMFRFSSALDDFKIFKFLNR